MTDTQSSEREEREAFEAFFRSRNSKGAEWRERMFDRRQQDDTYADDAVQRHWWTWQNCWQAARSRQQPKQQRRKP